MSELCVPTPPAPISLVNTSTMSQVGPDPRTAALRTANADHLLVVNLRVAGLDFEGVRAAGSDGRNAGKQMGTQPRDTADVRARAAHHCVGLAGA